MEEQRITEAEKKLYLRLKKEAEATKAKKSALCL